MLQHQYQKSKWIFEKNDDQRERIFPEIRTLLQPTLSTRLDILSQTPFGQSHTYDYSE